VRRGRVSGYLCHWTWATKYREEREMERCAGKRWVGDMVYNIDKTDLVFTVLIKPIQFNFENQN
jgi:hypothetical protein